MSPCSRGDCSLAPASEMEYQAGFDAACETYQDGAPLGDPVGVSEDYQWGWWNGVGFTIAFEEGYRAARRGVLTCPYTDAAEEFFVESWRLGYAAAHESDCCLAGRMQ